MEDVTKFTVAKLKDRLQQRGLPYTGKKAVLLQRLMESMEAEASGGEATSKVEEHSDSSSSNPDLPTPPKENMADFQSSEDFQHEIDNIDTTPEPDINSNFRLTKTLPPLYWAPKITTSE